MIRAWRLVSGPTRCALITALVAALAGTSGAVPRRLQLDAIASVPDFFLDGVVQVITSGDGAHVYAVSADDDAVSVFRRDAGTGFLHFVEAERDGVGGVEGLDGPRAITIVPDGAHVYVAAGNYLVVFGRNATTGELSFIGTLSGLSRPDAPVVSPDGAHLYVAGQESLAVFARDAGSGLLTLVEVEVDGVGGVDGIDDARSIAVGPDGAHLYVTGLADDAVAVFARDPVSGAVTFVEVVGDMDGAWPVVVSPGGAHVYVAGRGAIWAFARDAATGALSIIGAWETEVSARGLALSGDGAHVYLSADPSPDGIEWMLTFARDAATGLLAPMGRQFMAGNVFVTPDGAHVLMASGVSVVVLERDAASGALTLLTWAATVPYLHKISVAPDGAHVYAAGFSQLAIFARDAVTGGLRFVDIQPNAGPPTVSPDGRHVYTIEGYAIGVYARDIGTGALSLVERELSAVAIEAALVLSPDGATVYATAYEDDTVLVFHRDLATGALTFVEAEAVGLASGVGMHFPGALVVSPDGAHLYVASLTEGLIATFSRDAVTGALSFLNVAGTSVGGDLFPALDVGGLAISPDGAWVYAGGGGGAFVRGSVTVFARDPGTGALVPVATRREGEHGVSDVGGAIAVSPDGELLLMSSVGSAVVTGGPDLRFVEGRDWFLEPTEFVGYDAAFSPDGRHAYRAGYSQTLPGSVALLTRGFAGCTSGVRPSCRSSRRGMLLMRSAGGLVWRWSRGARTTLDDLGDPTATTDYALCVYDESGPTSALVLRALMPAGGDCDAGPPQCWSTAREGYRYQDPHGTPEGLSNLSFRFASNGAGRIALRGGGEHLGPPSLPLGLPIRVQLESSTGECWESVYSEARRNDETRFLAGPD